MELPWPDTPHSQVSERYNKFKTQFPELGSIKYATEDNNGNWKEASLEDIMNLKEFEGGICVDLGYQTYNLLSSNNNKKFKVVEQYDRTLSKISEIVRTLNSTKAAIFIKLYDMDSELPLTKTVSYIKGIENLVFLEIETTDGNNEFINIIKKADIKSYLWLTISYELDSVRDTYKLLESGVKIACIDMRSIHMYSKKEYLTFKRMVKEQNIIFLSSELSYNCYSLKDQEIRTIGFEPNPNQVNSFGQIKINLKNQTASFLCSTKDLSYFLKHSTLSSLTSIVLSLRKDTVEVSMLAISVLQFLKNNKNVYSFKINESAQETKELLSASDQGKSILNLLDQRIGPKLVKYIEEDKKTTYNRTKLTLVGKGAAGKSSCLRALLGQPFEEQHLSTVVADQEKNVSLLDSRDVNINSIWKEIGTTSDNGFFFNDLRALGKTVVNEGVAEELPIVSKNPEVEQENEVKDRDFSSVQDVSKLLRGGKPVKANTGRGVGNGIKRFIRQIRNNTNRTIGYKEELDELANGMKLVLWDFGGQDVFDTAHHFYFTNQGLVLLVFDIQGWINNQEEEKRHMEKWLNSLQYYAPNSHVFIAGTRALCPEVQKVGFPTVGEEIEEILENYDEVVIVYNKAQNLWFFPLENSQEEANSKFLYNLRRTIREVLEKPLVGKAFWKQEVSLAWLFFMHVIEEQKKNIVSLQYLENFGREKGFKQTELKLMLEFFTDAGAIVSFRSRFDKLQINNDLVDDTVIRPKWLIKSLASFLFADIHTKNSKAIKQLKGMRKWVRIHRRGILARTLFDTILGKSGSDPRENVFLATLCETMLVMSKVRFSDVEEFLNIKDRAMEKEEHVWLLPSMNSDVSATTAIDELKFSQSAQMIQLRWQDAVPQGLFERFTCAFLKHCDGRQGLEFKSLSKNLACLTFRDLHVALEKESRKIFNVIMQSKETDAVAAMKDVVDSILDDIEDLGLAIKLKAKLLLIKSPKRQGQQLTEKLKRRSRQLARTKPVRTELQVAPRLMPAVTSEPWDFDCFLSHSWGDWPEYMTHEQVVRIGGLIEHEGFKVWLDKKELKSTVSDAICEGIDGSSAFIAFVTRKYMFGTNDRNNNAGKEFNYAVKRGVENMIPVLLDSELGDPNKWGGNLGIHFGNALYIDFTTEAKIEENLGTLCERIKSLSSRLRPVFKYKG